MGMRSWAAALLAVALVMTGVTVPAQAASTAAQPTVVGNRLVDARTNTTFVPRGANWPGFEYACWQGWGYSGDTTGEAALMATWKINTVRIPLNEDCWLGLNGTPKGGTRTKEGYRTAVETFVTQLNAAGIVAVLDLHSSAPAGYVAQGQRAMPDGQSRDFWTSVATRFANNKSVMFDIFNEPYSRGSFQLSWDCWRNGGCQAPVEDDYTATLSGAKYSVVGMAELVGLVRAAGATQPVLLGGLNYSNDLSGWLANRPNDSQLVASWHNYPGQGCSTTCWNTTVTSVAAVVPIVTTEFGQTNGGNDYLVTFMDWADAHGIGYLPWAWWRVDPSESATNSLYALVGNDDKPKYPSGTALYAQLAKQPTPPTPSPSPSATPTKSPSPTPSPSPTKSPTPTPSPSPTSTPPTVSRVSGADRYATAVAISQAAFPGTAPVVFIATGANYPDALAAGPAAAEQGGPLLLTPGDALPASVTAELRRLKPAKIVVVGGTASVSTAVIAELKRLQPKTVRLSGDDRYATARAVVDYAFGTVDDVYIATGGAFPDALSASAAGPVVLVDGAGSLDSATSTLVKSLHPDAILVAGGSASVSSSILTSLRKIASTTRVSGADRYATSVAIAKQARTHAATVILATGEAFPDALAASAWAAKIGAPLITVPHNCVPAAALAAIRSFGAKKVVLVGGTASLSQRVAALTRC